jgi:hypothetical protein
MGLSAAQELLSIGEIAVTLVGFSGLISVFRARSVVELDPRDLSALAMIITSGALALTFALLPLPFAYTDLQEVSIWRVCAGVFAVALIVAIGVGVLVNARLAGSGHEERTPRLNRIALVIVSLMAVVLAYGSLAQTAPSAAIYLSALVICVLLCLLFVAFMIVVARRVG